MADDARPAEPEWVRDPDYLVFLTDPQAPLAVGDVEQHGVGDAISKLVGRKKEDVKADWEQVVAQMEYLLEKVSGVTSSYALEEVTFELGFSASGKVGFIAEAGIEGSVSATFKRRE